MGDYMHDYKAKTTNTRWVNSNITILTLNVSRYIHTHPCSKVHSINVRSACTYYVSYYITFNLMSNSISWHISYRDIVLKWQVIVDLLGDSHPYYIISVQIFEVCNFCRLTNFSGFIFEDQYIVSQFSIVKHRANCLFSRMKILRKTKQPQNLQNYIPQKLVCIRYSLTCQVCCDIAVCSHWTI